MATILEQDNTEDQEQQQGQPISTAPSAAPTPIAGMQPATPIRQGSSTRPNIQQYIKANLGAGQQIAGGIQQRFQQQTGQFGREAEKAGQELQAKAQPLQQELGEAGQQKIQTAFRDPQEILQNQQQLEQFQRLRDQGAQADISGVQQFGQQAASGLQGQLGGLQQQADLAGTEAGRFQLLRSAFGQPTYTSGQQKLDQLLLQTAPGAARQLQQQMQAGVTGGQQALGQFQQQTGAQTQSLQDLMRQRGEDIQKLFYGGAEEGLEADIGQRGLEDIGLSTEQRMEQARQAMEQVPGLQQRLAENRLTQEDINALGLSAGQKLYNVDLANYISQTANLPTLAGVADPQEFARYQALRQLSGDQGDIFGGATEAGTYRPYEFDLQRLQQTLGERQAKEQQLLTQSASGIQDIYNRFMGMGLNPSHPTNLAMSSYLQGPRTFEDLQNLLAFREHPVYGTTFGQQLQNLYAHPGSAQVLQAVPELQALDLNRILQVTSPELEGNVFSSPFNVV